METENKSSLIEEIDQQIDDKIKVLQADYDLQRSLIVERFRHETLEETKVYLEQELSELKTAIHQGETQAKWKVKKDQFMRRNELVDQLFEEVAQKLKSYSQTKAYDVWVSEKLDTALNTYPTSTDFKLIVRPVDQPFFERLVKTKAPHFELETDETIFIGGFILVNPSDQTELDVTLDYRLCTQKEWFYSHSGLEF